MGFADGNAGNLQKKISGSTDEEMRTYQTALAKGDTREAYYHLLGIGGFSKKEIEVLNKVIEN